jgi:mannose-6-phosphate isomerase
MLGTHAALTAHGRFPLLLKLLDCNDALSVQVHPDDACAAALGEPDPGKTEMWHVIDVRPGSELICGLDPGVTSARLRQAVLDNALEPYLERFTVVRGDSVYVPAGVVHAICPGLVLAEIQQNSDLTYRLYDWGRIQPDGTPRALHVEKAAQAIRYGFRHPGKSPALGIGHPGAGRQVLAACRFFAAELFQVANSCTRVTRGAAFHILLARDGRIEVSSGGSHRSLSPGEAVLVPGAAESWQADGDGALLDYYVPDLDRDIVAPLRDAGHSHLAVMRLVGD